MKMPKFGKTWSVALQTVLSGLMVTTLTAQDGLFQVDAASSRLTVRVGKAGFFAIAGNEHEVVAPAVAGTVSVNRTDIEQSSVLLEFDATTLRLTGKGEPPGDVPEVQRVMMSERVLDVERYPKITFRSRRVVPARSTGVLLALRLDGELTLHGVTRPVTVLANVRVGDDSVTAEGKATLKQTDFGIRPVTAGVGTVRVRDEVDIVFEVTARRQ